MEVDVAAILNEKDGVAHVINQAIMAIMADLYLNYIPSHLILLYRNVRTTRTVLLCGVSR